MGILSASSWLSSLKKSYYLLQNAPKLKRWRDRFKGQRCFILGNGGSLKEQDLSLLADEHVFITNWFVLHPEFNKLNKSYYFCGDPRFFQNNEFKIEIQRALEAHPNIQCFFDRAGERALKNLSLDSKLSQKCHFLLINQKKPVWEGFFDSMVTRGVSWGWTTIVDMCLPMAFYMGFEELYLLGCDCDYRLDKADDFSDSYFFNPKDLPADDYLHLLTQKGNPDQFNRTGKLFKSYEVVKQYFEEHGRKIYNAGEGGKLEVFPRVAFESLFT